MDFRTWSEHLRGGPIEVQGEGGGVMTIDTTMDRSPNRPEMPVPLDDSMRTLGEQIAEIHDRVREIAPAVTRMAFALYEPHDDLLKTFINSTHDGWALAGYQYRLRDSFSLSEIAATRTPRALTDIPHQLDRPTAHTEYVKGEGYISSFTVPMFHHGELLGFVFFDSRDPAAFTPPVMRQLVVYCSLVTLAVVNDMSAISSVISTIQIARDFTQLRDNETAHHRDRMARYSRIMARDQAREFGLTDEQVEHVFLFAPMHDIGKIGIPDRILLKPGKLTHEEFEVMKTHTTLGGTMVDSILRDLDRISVPDQQMLFDIVVAHHEKLDGSGYPNGLRGDEVPAAARIVAVADIFDALTSDRPYKRQWSVDDAFDELHRMVEAGLLDARAVAALVNARAEVEQVRTTYPN